MVQGLTHPMPPSKIHESENFVLERRELGEDIHYTSQEVQIKKCGPQRHNVAHAHQARENRVGKMLSRSRTLETHISQV
jgi:hypothetical protein